MTIQTDFLKIDKQLTLKINKPININSHFGKRSTKWPFITCVKMAIVTNTGLETVNYRRSLHIIDAGPDRFV